jgi:hypothetical protein
VQQDVLLAEESLEFTEKILRSLKCTNAETASFAVSVLPAGEKSPSNWNGFFLDASRQMFIKSMTTSPLCKLSLVTVLDMAEQLGASEAFVCLPHDTKDAALLVNEYSSMGFVQLSPRLTSLNDYIVLRFDF